MKTAYRDLEYLEKLSFKKDKPGILKNVFQLFLNLAILYIGSKIYINILRSLTGH
jgi:hypothetical protein